MKTQHELLSDFRPENLLKDLVQIDSPSQNIQGVNLVQDRVVEELLKLGGKVQRIPQPIAAISSGDLIVAEWTGLSPEFLTLVSHADTVLDSSSTGPYTTFDDDRAKGSGVIDNKGGIVTALLTLREYLGRHPTPIHSLRFVCSPNEEVGSPGFTEYFKLLSQDSIAVLGFEPALDDGWVIDSRRGNRWYDVQVQGVSGHAGRCSGEEINAAHDLAMKIAKLHTLTNHHDGVSVNVAGIEAGDQTLKVFNVVCGEARARIDTRFRTFAQRDSLHKALQEILLVPRVVSIKTGGTSQTSFTIADDCPPFSLDQISEKHVQFLIKKISGFENSAIGARSGGGAGDTNHFSRPGLIVIDGLGPVGGKMHTSDEFIYLPSLKTRSQAVAELFFELEGDLLIGQVSDLIEVERDRCQQLG